MSLLRLNQATTATGHSLDPKGDNPGWPNGCLDCGLRTLIDGLIFWADSCCLNKITIIHIIDINDKYSFLLYNNTVINNLEIPHAPPSSLAHVAPLSRPRTLR